MSIRRQLIPQRSTLFRSTLSSVSGLPFHWVCFFFLQKAIHIYIFTHRFPLLSQTNTGMSYTLALCVILEMPPHQTNVFAHFLQAPNTPLR